MKEITVTADNFTKEVSNSSLPVIVDFWASWCVPCTMMSGVIAEIAEEYDGKIKVGKVNVDEEDTLAEQFNIDAIPAVYLFKGGKVVATSLGYKSKDALLKELGL